MVKLFEVHNIKWITRVYRYWLKTRILIVILHKPGNVVQHSINKDLKHKTRRFR